MLLSILIRPVGSAAATKGGLCASEVLPHEAVAGICVAVALLCRLVLQERYQRVKSVFHFSLRLFRVPLHLAHSDPTLETYGKRDGSKLQ